ncbi:hypothetical protein SGLAM104S_07855 [Streptomyces glaucescens]
MDPRGRSLATLTVSGYEAPRASEALVEVRQPDEQGHLSAPVRLRLPDAHVVDFAMSPDGSRLILYVVHWKFTADGKETDGEMSRGLEVWDVRTGRQESVISGNWPNDLRGWVDDGGADRLVSFAPGGDHLPWRRPRRAAAPAWTCPWDAGVPLTVAGDRSGDRAAVATGAGTTLAGSASRALACDPVPDRGLAA